MSALFQGLVVDGVLPITVGASAPDHYRNGIPLEADGSISVESGAIAYYNMGLPFTAAGRIAVDAGPVTYYGSGAAPMSSAGMLVMGSGPLTHYASGVPYGSDGALVSSGLSQFVFNGIDQYISIPGWQPYGLNFQIQAHGNPEDSFISDRIFYAGGDFDKTFIQAGAGTLSMLYVDATGSPVAISTGTATLGEDIHMVGNFNAEQSSLVINGSAQSGAVAGPTLMAPITTIGADWDGGDYFNGPLWGFQFYDYSPIQDTDAKTGAVGTLPDIPMAEAVVSFDYICPAAGEDILVGYISFNGTLHTLEMTIGTNLTVDGVAYVNKYLETGQHIRVSFEADGTTLSAINAISGMQNLTIESTVYE